MVYHKKLYMTALLNSDDVTTKWIANVTVTSLVNVVTWQQRLKPKILNFTGTKTKNRLFYRDQIVF